jgi:acetoin utilization protein AcuC
MNKVVLVYDAGFKKLDFGHGHPMRGDRYEKAVKEFRKMSLLGKLTIKKPKVISEDIINLFHTNEYIKKVQQVSKTGKGVFGQEVPSVKGIYEIVSLSVGASVTAADYATESNEFDIAVNICGGWHHAFEDMGRGFCVFNDIAVTANYLLERKNIKKIMVVDYDAHHGDGTQRAFYSNPKAYTVSFHQGPATLYPFKTGYKNEVGEKQGKGFNKNFPLSSTCNDSEFIAKFNEVPKLIENFAPEVLILQMGVDGSKECSISGMQLTKDAYDYSSSLLMDLQKKYRFKIIALGGGGFTHPMLGQNWGIQIKNFIEK